MVCLVAHLEIEVKRDLSNLCGPKIKIGALKLTWNLLMLMKTKVNILFIIFTVLYYYYYY